MAGGGLFDIGALSAVTMTACWFVALFLASAGASAAYLTVSEVFPMETRALAISFFTRSAPRPEASAGRCCSPSWSAQGKVSGTLSRSQSEPCS